MDNRRFDGLAKSLGTVHSRRGLTRLLGSLGLGSVLTGLGGREAAARTKIGGSRCTRNRQCKTNNCLGSNECSCSQNHPDCKRPNNPCKEATCNFATKRCVITNKDAGTACDEDKTCDGGVCACPAPVGTGKAVGDPCDPRRPSECTSGVCGCNRDVCPCFCRSASCVGPGDDCAGNVNCCKGICTAAGCV
jgi:hypothetical protein